MKLNLEASPVVLILLGVVLYKLWKKGYRLIKKGVAGDGA